MIKLIIHATHEAGLKVGGIGAVLDGLLGADQYNSHVARTVLVGTFNRYDSFQMERMLSPRSDLTIVYAPVIGVNLASPDLAAGLSAVEQDYGVALLYGKRRFGSAEHEVLLIDSIHARPEPANAFRYFVWQRYGIDSARYDYDLEYKDFMRAAPASYAALRSLVGPGDGGEDRTIIAHEWMGMPLVFAAQLNDPSGWQTVFYAHEMATARNLVEFDRGHDARFYNALDAAEGWGLSLEDLFGDRSNFHKHAIVRQAMHCDNIFAVGDRVVDELRFLGGPFRSAPIDLVYNGLAAQRIALREKLSSKGRLQDYAATLLQFRPDYVFTHVTRLVLSKALWRDVRVAEQLDGLLAGQGRTAVLFMLSTSALMPGGRRPADVLRWEAEYGWPLDHRTGNGDLVDLETPLYQAVAGFNRQSRALKIVLVNQFGWSRERCGVRMPPDMTFADIRLGSDVEFGQSIYEPFGIAQVEPLGFGALCVVSNVCGCVGYVRQAAAGQPPFPNLIVADTTSLPPDFHLYNPWSALYIGQDVRERIEAASSVAVARQIMERLPRDEDDMQHLLESGQAVAEQMSWEVVVRDYLLPGLRRARNSDTTGPS